SPSVTFGDSSLSEGAFGMLLLFIRFLLIGKAFIEPRHYGGVFVLQKELTCKADQPLELLF
ncbi:MAG: hypothetical protein IJW50_05925, partial [Clostridia bacterium]|nr:hypothetical protein [Clostridia bacterium]